LMAALCTLILLSNSPLEFAFSLSSVTSILLTLADLELKPLPSNKTLA
jgi:hypothetical protein